MTGSFEGSTRVFSDRALEGLDSMAFDENATYKYELMSGAFLWSDELPAFTSEGWTHVKRWDLYRHLLALRRQITLGVEGSQDHPLWVQVSTRAPNWPGLRSERHSGRIVNRLKAAIRKSNYELQKAFEADDLCDGG